MRFNTFEYTGRSSVYLSAMPGETIALSASGSYDPDNDELGYMWSVYEEPFDYEGEVTVKNDLYVKDDLNQRIVCYYYKYDDI